jgi:glycosyltransferase involved in cell wall biosynthesis
MQKLDEPVEASSRSGCDHTFAICAYGQSPFLEECIESVLSQDLPGSEVFIATSTPSEWLDGLAEKYRLPVFVNIGASGIGQDWNFAYSQSTRSFVTIAHQDDVYCPGYAHHALDLLQQSSHPLIFFCNYGEIREGERVDDNKLLRVKRKMLSPFKNGRFSGSIFMRRRMLSLGSPICCPSVTFSRTSLSKPPFRTEMKCSLDWDTWEKLSRYQGDFLYCSDILMYHRIHEGSATTNLIENSTRTKEDLELFQRFWPDFIARSLNRRYSSSQKSNELG